MAYKRIGKFRWITNGIENKQISLSDSLPEGWKVGAVHKCVKENPSHFKKGHINHWIEKNRLTHIGKKHSEETKKTLKTKLDLRLSTGWSASKTAWQRITKEVVELEKQGYRCIPITSCIPDIIAIKNEKVYAVEVEYQRPNYNKYENSKHRYDEIIWLLRGPWKK